MGWLDRWLGRSDARPKSSRWRVTVSPSGLTSESSFPGSEPSRSRFAWDAVVGAHEERAVPGLQILLTVPPYVEFVPEEAEGFGELDAELERRGLLGPEEKVGAVWTERLSQILEETVERLFGPEQSGEAREILAAGAGDPHPRVALAVLTLGGESLDMLRGCAEQARDDARDVLKAAWD